MARRAARAGCGGSAGRARRGRHAGHCSAASRCSSFCPTPISISHAGLAQIFFCLTISLALFTSAGWRRPPAPPVDDERLRRRTAALTALVYVQILLGATMRHTGAGLAIPDFPLSYGRLHPAVLESGHRDPFRSSARRGRGAALVVAVVWRILVRHRSRPELVRPAWFLVRVSPMQITLGAFVVLTGKQPDHQHAARRDRRPRARHVALPHAAGVSSTLGSAGCRPSSRPSAPSNMKPDLVAYDKPHDAGRVGDRGSRMSWCSPRCASTRSSSRRRPAATTWPREPLDVGTLAACLLRHRARRERRRGDQSSHRTRHRPADGAHAAAARRRRPDERRRRLDDRGGACRPSVSSCCGWQPTRPRRSSRSRRL